MISRLVGPALASATSIRHSSAGTPSTTTNALLGAPAQAGGRPPPSDDAWLLTHGPAPIVDSRKADAASMSSVTYPSCTKLRNRSLRDRMSHVLGDPPVRPAPDGRRGEIGQRGGNDSLQGVDEAVGFISPGLPDGGTPLGECALAFGADEDDEVLHHAPADLGAQIGSAGKVLVERLPGLFQGARMAAFFDHDRPEGGAVHRLGAYAGKI